MPIISRKPSASITIVGFFSMKLASGVAATSITVIATITAMYMIASSSVMPTAVMIEFDREDQVEQQDLEDRPAQRDRHGLADHVVLVVLRIDGVVDLLGRLPDQEEAAGDQDQVAPGEAVPEGGEDRLRSSRR